MFVASLVIGFVYSWRLTLVMLALTPLMIITTAITGVVSTLKFHFRLRCRHILKTMKNFTVAKFEPAFTRCRNNLKTVGNSPVKSSLQDFDAKEVYLNPKNRSVSFQKRLKMSYFHHFKVFTRCRFQNVPMRVSFSKSTVFKICWQKMCRFHVNRRPIRRIFHNFQNVPASCERSLSSL